MTISKLLVLTGICLCFWAAVWAYLGAMTLLLMLGGGAAFVAIIYLQSNTNQQNSPHTMQRQRSDHV